MIAEYRCLFGIAKPEGMPAPAGVEWVTYDKYLSSLTISVKGGNYYFFIFHKLDRIYPTNEIPRFTREDAEQFAESISEFPIQAEHEFKGRLKFSDLWKHQKSFTLVPLEEAQYQCWTFGRIACLGNSIHKGTPNAGEGGNNGIESAAAFANSLVLLQRDTFGKRKAPNRLEVRHALLRYQNNRQKRVYAYLDIAKELTLLQALSDFKHKMFTL